jgi:hypothetical protein
MTHKNSARMQLWIAGLALLVLAIPARADLIRGDLIVAHFDDLPERIGSIPDGYGGITWGGSWTYTGIPVPNYPRTSDPNGVLPDITVLPLVREYQFSFDTPDRNFLGAWFAGPDEPDPKYGLPEEPTIVRFHLYNGGMLVHTTPDLAMLPGSVFQSSGYSGPVDAVGVYSNNPGFYIMDDVTYSVGQVPEPVSALLAMTGALGLIGYAAGSRADPRRTVR